MRKAYKALIVIAVILCLTLALFSACTPDNKSFSEKYGITFEDKIVKYNAQEQAFEISVDQAILDGKAFTVEYTYDGKTVTKPKFKDAGVYEVKAKITVDGEKEPVELSAKYTINKADLTIEIGNLFLEQGKGSSSIGAPSANIANIKFQGDDKIAVLGTMTFEFMEGSTKITDLSKIKPITDVNKGLTVGLKLATAPKNYDVTVTNGKLYVLSSQDYVLAKSLRDGIAKTPTTTTINTFDYYAMKDFVNSSDEVIEKYPSTTAVQRLMTGTVDVEAVKTLKRTASSRINTVYDFEIDSDYAKLEMLGVTHSANDSRATDDDDYKTEFDPKKESAKKNAEYGDTVAFKIDLGTNKGKYIFLGATINGVPFDVGRFTDNNDGTYSMGAANDTAPTGDRYGPLNKGANGGLSMNNTLLGALDGKSTITIVPNIVSIHDVVMFDMTPKTADEIEHGQNTPGANISNVTLASKASGTLFTAATSSEPKKTARMGEELKLSLFAKPGYSLLEIEIGDEIVKASDFVNNVYTFTLEEKHLASEKLNIKIKMQKSYNIKTMIDGKVKSNSNRDGIYVTNEGTLTYTGVSEDSIPTIFEGSSFKITINPATNYVISSFKITGKIGGVSLQEPIDLTSDIIGSTSNSVTIDIGTGNYNFDSTSEIIIDVKYAKEFNAKVSASVGEFNSTIVSDETTMTLKGDSFTSAFGSVTFTSPDGYDTYSKITDGKNYFINVEPQSGYVLKQLKINGTIVPTAKLLLEDNKYRMLTGETVRIGASQTSPTINEAYLSSEFSALSDNKAAKLSGGTKLEAGEDFVVEAVFVPFYFVNISSWPTYVQLTPNLKGTITASGSNVSYAPKTDSTAAIIKVGDNRYYVFGGDKEKITVTAKNIGTGNKALSEYDFDIGEDKDDFGTLSIDGEKLRTASVNDAIGTKIKPGDDIDIVFDGIEKE